MLRAGFASKTFSGITLASVLLVMVGRGFGADLSLPVTGNLLGSVADSTGTPQMGVAIQLFNKYQQLVARTASDSQGRFAFVSIPVDLYSVHASLSSFLPVSRDKIAIQAGLDSVLRIHLATLFSKVEVSYVLPTAAMTEDWKWVLRSSAATRPINRYLPSDPADQLESAALRPHIFSETHALVSISGGDGGLADAGFSSSDVGTSFALSTNFLGKNQLQVSGSLGENAAFGPPAVAFGVVYSRNDDGFLARTPEVILSMAQVGGVGLPALAQNTSGNPALTNSTLRAMSLSVYQTADPVDGIHLEYGASLLAWRQIPVLLDGNVIRIPGHELFVAEACSGLRSLTALISLGVLLGAILLRHAIGRLFLLAAVIPVAIVLNGVRVFLTGFLVYFIDPALGEGFMHKTEGMAVFIVAFAIIGALALGFGAIEQRLLPPAARAGGAGAALPAPTAF